MRKPNRLTVAVPLFLLVMPVFEACEAANEAGPSPNLNLDSGNVTLPPANDASGSVVSDAQPDVSTLDAADASLCGNGVIDPGETCDGNCPTSCADSLACTNDVLVGDPQLCNVACEHAATQCANGDSCCAPGCDSTNDTDCVFTVADEFKTNYSVRTLGTADGVVVRYGGLVVSKDDPYTLLIGGEANGATGKLFAVHLQRDAKHHIVAIDGTAKYVGDAPYNDGGFVYAPNGALAYARYPTNEIGFIRPANFADAGVGDGGMDGGADAGASFTVDKVVPLTGLGVPSSLGGLMLVPAGFPGAGTWKSISWGGGQWYELMFADDGSGLYDVTGATSKLTLTGGPEGVAYVRAGSPLFPSASIVVSEYSAGKVATYTIDQNGDPVLASRREVITALTGAEGAFIDPLSGDYLFSTYGGANQILVVSGFDK